MICSTISSLIVFLLTGRIFGSEDCFDNDFRFTLTPMQVCYGTASGAIECKEAGREERYTPHGERDIRSRGDYLQKLLSNAHMEVYIGLTFR